VSVLTVSLAVSADESDAAVEVLLPLRLARLALAGLAAASGDLFAGDRDAALEDRAWRQAVDRTSSRWRFAECGIAGGDQGAAGRRWWCRRKALAPNSVIVPVPCLMSERLPPVSVRCRQRSSCRWSLPCRA